MIFVVSRGLPCKQYPLNGIFELDQARALQAYGHKIVFFVLDFRSIRRSRKYGFFSTVKEDIKCFCISFPLGNIEHPFFNFIARKLTRIGTRLIIKRFGKPNILHAHFAQISSLAIEIKRILNVPLVVTEHNSSLNADTINPKLYALAKTAYHNADLVITVSSSLSTSLALHFKIATTVVSNIVNNALFNPKQKVTMGSNKEHFTFVSVGALDFRKGFDVLVNAFSISKFVNAVKLKIIGDGELLEPLRQKVKELGTENNIEFMGFQPREKIAEEFNAADSFVLASRRETFGLVYVEALFSGLPVIATPCGGPEEFINESNGILVPVNQVEKLSEAMMYMVNNYDRYDGLQISKTAVNQFAPNIIAKKLSELYDIVLADQKINKKHFANDIDN